MSEKITQKTISRNKQAGFTLIELMTSFALIGIIVMTALPAYEMFRQRAYDALSRSDVSNVLRGIYSIQATEDDSPVFLFNQEGPLELPAPLEQYSLSKGVVADFIIKLPLFGGNELIFVSMYHPNGAYRFREIDFLGNRTRQRIEL